MAKQLSNGAIVGIAIAVSVALLGIVYTAACLLVTPKLKASDALLLYQLMKDADQAFCHHGVMYLAESGTLLGAVRHGGIIPHDDDLDIQIRAEDEVAFATFVLPELKTLGYGYKELKFGYKIYPESGKWMPELIKFPFMDVVVVTNDGVRTRGRERTFDKYHFCLNEIHPITRYKFGEFEINGPRDPNGFLDRAYGKDWKDTWLATHSHSLYLFFFLAKPQKMRLEDYFPAQPTGPLVKRTFANLAGK